MARNDWDRDRGYGGDYRQNRGWTGGWSGRDRDDWDRESRWMNQRVGWSGQDPYGGDYTGTGWQGGWNGGYGDRGRRGRPGGWDGGWAGAEPGIRRRGWGAWGGRTPGGADWGWNRPGRAGGWRGAPRRTGYGSTFQGPAYGGEYLGSSRAPRRREYGRWGGYGARRSPAHGAYYGGEYGW